MLSQAFDVIVIGAGAAGLFCAIEAGKRRRSVLVLDHANKAGKKILMSGGGRCNFTNYHINPSDYISHNPHFCKSALSRYTQWDFIELVNRHSIPFHEKTLGQLFCDLKSKAILEMLLTECEQANVTIKLDTVVERIDKGDKFVLKTTAGLFTAESLVIASGGLSIPTMGASGYGYQVARQFGLNVWPTRAGLVPFTLADDDKARFAQLSGVAADALVSNEQISFREGLLFTHRGLSGPAVLQISSYWQVKESIAVDLLPGLDLLAQLKRLQRESPQRKLRTVIVDYLAKRIVDAYLSPTLGDKTLAETSFQDFGLIADAFKAWTVKPQGTEGYRTAEVTLGGVDCDALSSKTMMVKTVPGLYFIGEVVDVTGWLGGYNFQWAWSSGWAAGQVV